MRLDVSHSHARRGALIASQSATMHIRSHHVMCEPPNARSHWLALGATSVSLCSLVSRCQRAVAFGGTKLTVDVMRSHVL